MIYELPPGMDDLGPSQDLNQGHPKLLGANGQPAEAPAAVKAPPIEWILDEENTTNPKKPLYYPKLETPIAVEFGASRPHKMFFPGERNLFINLFTMHLSQYLFGIPCMKISQDGDGAYGVRINPEFDELPTYKPEEGGDE